VCIDKIGSVPGDKFTFFVSCVFWAQEEVFFFKTRLPARA
jgi:hypothetical protein